MYSSGVVSLTESQSPQLFAMINAQETFALAFTPAHEFGHRFPQRSEMRVSP